MGKFEADRFNGFFRRGLVKGLYEDLRNCLLFKEGDVHAAAYYYIRKFLERKGRDRLIVRCNATLKGPGSKRPRPDVVVFNHDKPIYAVELKVFESPIGVKRASVEKKVEEDVRKLETLIRRHGLSYGFLIVVYDSERELDLPDRDLRKQGIERVSVVEINMRFDVKTQRQRRNYKEWRRQFDAIWEAQRNGGLKHEPLGTLKDNDKEGTNVDVKPCKVCDHPVKLGNYGFCGYHRRQL